MVDTANEELKDEIKEEKCFSEGCDGTLVGLAMTSDDGEYLISFILECDKCGTEVSDEELFDAYRKSIQSPWILASDKLPEEGTEVLTAWKGCLHIDHVVFEHNIGYCFSDGFDLITHWMPMPSLPEKE